MEEFTDPEVRRIRDIARREAIQDRRRNEGNGGGLSAGDDITELDATAHRTFYSDGSGDIQELAHGTSGHVLTSNGASSAPSWQASGGGSGGQIQGAYDIEDATFTDAGMTDEFGSSTLDGQWTAVGVSSGTVGLLASTEAYDLTTRSGTLLVQVGSNTGHIGFRVDDMLTNGEQIIVSCGASYPVENVAVNNQYRVGISANDNDSDPEGGDFVIFYWDGTTDGMKGFDGTTTTHHSNSYTAGSRFYLRMARDSDTLYGFWSFDGTVWANLGSDSVASKDNFWIWTDSNAAFNSGPYPVTVFNWVRHVANTNFDPW